MRAILALSLLSSVAYADNLLDSRQVRRCMRLDSPMGRAYVSIAWDTDGDGGARWVHVTGVRTHAARRCLVGLVMRRTWEIDTDYQSDHLVINHGTRGMGDK